MAQSPYKRLLRNYLLDSKVQLRFTLMMVAISTLLTAGLGYVWYAEVRVASRLARVNAVATMGIEGAKQLEAELDAKDAQRLAVIVGFAVLLALLIAIYGIMVSHKFAGPLHKIKRHMNDIEQGRLYHLWGLRKGDQLQDFFAAFHAMHLALRSRIEEDMKVLSRTIAAVEQNEQYAAELEALKALRQLKGDSLRDAGDLTQRIDREDISGHG